MTRISTPSPAPADQPELAREQARNDAGTRAGAQFAALYRGTTRFAYARTRSASARRALLARKLRMAVPRPLVAAGEPARGAGAGGSGRITRDGGGGSGGQSQHGHDGGDSGGNGNGRGGAASSRGEVGIRSSGKTEVPLPRRGALQTFAASQPPDADLSHTLPKLWCDALLALRDELAVNPEARLDARVHERFIDLLTVQRQLGGADAASGIDGDLGAWRQRLIDASSARAQPPKTMSAARVAPGEPGRVGRLNLLMLPLLLMYSRPATPAMRERALNLRTLQRGAAVAAGAADKSR
ncbi:hypothetical protein ACOCG7_07410 [Paraburkholderia sp. DD10]|uniref:hypothetical protein n=1 Tax=Paraburkholderia sp. DD10 TaxID=3409691 RepID=UPI003BA1B5B2